MLRWLACLAPVLGACDYVFTVRLPDAQDPPLDEPGCLFDDFKDASLDPLKWADPPPSPVQATLSNNQLLFTLPPTVDMTLGDFTYLSSGRLYDMTDGSLQAELVVPPDPAAQAYTGVVFGVDGVTVVETVIGNGAIYGASYDSMHLNGEFTRFGLFDAQRHRVLRVVSGSGVITFEARDAAGTVTFQETLPSRFSVAQVYIELIGGTFGNVVATQAGFDNVLADGPNCANTQ